ncbi:TetR/AcrR family transcriptional regulator [Dermacoccus sp. PAMC28757]|uniref:TetR/AcrR family transcriptional regulator n=1 Tax=Dermacoccus sp. PAMC28757 TaxID=2762331 RepID=UPI0021067843|nr:TetR/AcrR family transcriptional regulator [Dermacoccus sp. PAMC28757]
METFWTHGYAATTPAQLAEATGVGTSSLYNAFHSKRELFDLCLDLYQTQVDAMAHSLLEQPGTTLECIRAAFRAVVDDDLAQGQRRGCLIGNTIVELAGADPDLAARLKKMQDASIQWIADRIRRGQVEGDVASDKGRVASDKDSEVIAEHLATTLAGLRVMGVLHDRATLYRVIDSALTILA